MPYELMVAEIYRTFGYSKDIEESSASKIIRMYKLAMLADHTRYSK